MTTPVPIGVGSSFAKVRVGGQTANFTLPEGIHVIAFQPVDVNNPGVVTLYDTDEAGDNLSADMVVLTMTIEGYETIQVPSGGNTYYFTASLGANILAAIQPTVWR